jgi:hypothetical protein
MNITESFEDPERRGEYQELSLHLVKATREREAYVEFHLGISIPRISIRELDVFIGMLQSLQRRHGGK